MKGGNLVPSTPKCQISIRQLLFNINNLIGSSSFHVFILYLIILTIVYILTPSLEVSLPVIIQIFHLVVILKL